MNVRLVSLVFVCLTLLAVPAFADVVYDDGPINGTVDAFSINFGGVVSNTFTISSGNSTLSGMSFGAWMIPGDVLQSAEVSITSEPDGGTSFFDQTVSFTQSACNANPFGFNVCTETGNFQGPSLANGTYWVTLQNALATDGDPVAWDQNSGVGCSSPGCPSMGNNLGVGSIPGEAFTIYGNASGGTPEPGTLILFGSGIAGVMGFLRRKRG